MRLTIGNRSAWLVIVTAALLVSCGDKTEPGSAADAPGSASEVIDAPGGSAPPTVSITSPEDGAVVPHGEAVTLRATVTDDRDALDTLSLSWTSNLAGALSSAPANAAGLAQVETTNLSAGEHTITLTVSDSEGLSAEASITLLVNAAPTAPTVSISPEKPGTVDELVASVSMDATDLNRDSSALSYVYHWYKSGEAEGPESNTLPAALTSKGETWQVRVQADDGHTLGAEGTAQVTIANSPPVCAKATLLSSTSAADTTFECACVEWSDPDGDEPSADTCAFTDEATDTLLTQGGADDGSCTLSPELIEKGMSLTCTLIPSDGEDAGEPITTDPVLVLNAAPTPPTGVTLSPNQGCSPPDSLLSPCFPPNTQLLL